MAQDSQRIMLVFGSWIAGARPLGFMERKGSFFMSAMSTILAVKGRSSSLRTRAVLKGFGPPLWE